MENTREINVKIRRFNPAEGDTQSRYESYTVPIVERGTSVMNVLQYISEHYDGGLAYYISCRRGECAGCTVRVNGRARLACLEIVDSDLVLEPMSSGKVVKDLVTIPRDRNGPSIDDYLGRPIRGKG